MFLGIDLGTSAVKAVLVDETQAIVDQESAPLETSRPHPLWSEQDPESWWIAANQAVAALKARRPEALRAVRAVGLSGQMHGATLLDGRDRPLRPAILWNDGRSGAECVELEARAPELRRIAGNLAMPGFTAPKLLWVRRREPEIFQRTARVLLPKDYLRLRMTGLAVSDMSDASGTLWLDVGRRDWSDALLAATDLTRRHMPSLVEGSEESARLSPEVARDWGMETVPVAGGGGDNAAGAVGVGVIRPGEAFLSLGTSGVLFACTPGFAPNPEQAAHAFCHALPELWHQMAVILSAASCLSWAAQAFGLGDAGALLAEVEAAGERDLSPLLFLPYLSGERTPHNDPHAKGAFVGLTHGHDRAALGRAVLEGVAFAFADGARVLKAVGTGIDAVSVIGGGARSRLWGRILASALGRNLTYRAGGEVGPAFGAARLARLCATGEAPEEICAPPPVLFEIEPDPRLTEVYDRRKAQFRALYGALRERFAELDR